MKLKLLVLLALFAAGAFASFALADNGKHAKKAEGKCHEVHISGTIAPQTLVVTVDQASAKRLIAAGTQLSLAVGSTGQTVRVKAEACATGTGSSLALTIKQVELRPARVKAVEAVQTSTQEKRHTGEDEHKGKKGATTTSTTTTTTATTTSAGTTTTTP
jgi:hypothetical protein